MRLAEATQQVIPLIQADIERFGLVDLLDPTSPDGDPAKFILNGRIARITNPRDGFYAKVNLDWLRGSKDLPLVKKGEFYWYVFPLYRDSKREIRSYFICDYEQMRKWVCDFSAPKGNPHDDHGHWRGEIHFLDADEYGNGYMRWGDEPLNEGRSDRFITIRNIRDILPAIQSRTLIDELTEYDFSAADGMALHDLQQFENSYQALDRTERDAVIQSRLGQGRFRQQLVDYWGGCSVTGAEKIDLLIASHIKPWSASNNSERLDVYNGLLLQPNLDSVFDRGMISFNERGSILISEELSVEYCLDFHIDPRMKLRQIERGHLKYLGYHSGRIFQR